VASENPAGLTPVRVDILLGAGNLQIAMAADHTLSIVLEPQEGGGFAVLVPALPEFLTEGDPEGAALANTEEAIRAVLAYRLDRGITIPSDVPPEVRRVTVAA
jgi:antitoxin HicB